MAEKYKVYWKNGKAHLSEDGRKTFCGQKIPFNNFAVDQPATINEFLTQVHRRCSGCKVGAEITALVDAMTGGETEALDIE